MAEIEGLRGRAENILVANFRNKRTFDRSEWLFTFETVAEQMADFAALIQQETWEECAKIAERMLNGKGIAAAIRDLQREENKNGSF